jgi:hypothetical protein
LLRLFKSLSEKFEQELDIEQEGAEPILVNNLIKSLFTDIKTPVNPEPEIPPLAVNMVTVCPVNFAR